MQGLVKIQSTKKKDPSFCNIRNQNRKHLIPYYFLAVLFFPSMEAEGNCFPYEPCWYWQQCCCAGYPKSQLADFYFIKFSLI